MKVLAGPNTDPLVARYLNEKIGLTVTTPFIAFAVFTEEGRFVAGLMVSNFRKTDCEISMAAETANWARKGIMRYIFEYLFIKAGLVRCTCVVQNIKGNGRTRRFLEGIGFVLEGNLRLAYDGKIDALIYGLLRRDCKFLRENQGGTKRGEEVGASAAASS